MPWISHAPPFILRICLVVRGRRRSCCSDIPFCAPRSTVLSCAIWHRQWLRSATFANWNAKDRSVIGLNEVAAGIRTRVLSRARGIITRSPDCTRRAVTGSSIIQGANLGIDQFPDVACLLPHSRLTRASVQILRQGAGGCGMPGMEASSTFWRHICGGEVTFLRFLQFFFRCKSSRRERGMSCGLTPSSGRPIFNDREI